ncbi:MAG: hypothetical protein ACYDCM_10375 [Candidatus Acidiferrales bacterium]
MKKRFCKAGAGIAGVLFVASVMTLVAPKTVHALVSALVTVANTSANPVPVDPDGNAANDIVLTSLVQLSGTSDFIEQSPFVDLHSGSPYVVPNGKRFVIDNVNVHYGFGPGGHPALNVALLLNEGSNGAYRFSPPVSLNFSGGGEDSYNGGQEVRLFEDPGGQFGVIAGTDGTVGAATVNVYIVGRLIDCGAGCAGQ